MVAVVIIIIVFVRRAKELGLNIFLWGAIGFAAYFLIQILAGTILAVVLDVIGSSIEQYSEVGLNFAGIILGGICTYLAYQEMPNYAERKNQALDDDLLDENMFR